MKRSDLEHVIRAANAIANTREVIIIGSQAILAQYPNAPAALCVSAEADLYPAQHVERAELIEGAIGEGSHFHHTYGYYANGVGPETAVLPRGWEERLVSICNENTSGTVGLCLEVHDIAISKYAAGREKDLDYLDVLWRAELLDAQTLRQRLDATDLGHELRALTSARIARHQQEHRERGQRASQQTHEVEERALRLAEGESARGPGGAVHDNVATIYRGHCDAIPVTLITEPGKAVFGLSTRDGEVTVLYRITEGREHAFARWMHRHEGLWGTPFHDPNEGNDALARYASQLLSRSRGIAGPGGRT